MANLAIKGHSNRGDEVIEILEMLGGKNETHIKATVLNAFYYINEDGKMYLADKYSDMSNFVIYTLEEFLEKFPYKVGDKVQHKGATSCGSVYEVEKMRWEEDTVKYTLRLFGCNYKSSTLLAEYLQPYKEEIVDTGCCSMPTTPPSYKLSVKQLEEVKQTIVFSNDSPDETELVLGDNYEVKVKDGKTYVVKKQPKYPKTYEECIGKLLINWDGKVTGYKCDILTTLQKLLIARDVYWKIAGEQMGLGKSWEPDWLNVEQDKYVLFTHNNSICSNRYLLGHNILAFPTEEMRDAFYENFKELINETKELL